MNATKQHWQTNRIHKHDPPPDLSSHEILHHQTSLCPRFSFTHTIHIFHTIYTAGIIPFTFNILYIASLAQCGPLIRKYDFDYSTVRSHYAVLETSVRIHFGIRGLEMMCSPYAVPYTLCEGKFSGGCCRCCCCWPGCLVLLLFIDVCRQHYTTTTINIILYSRVYESPILLLSKPKTWHTHVRNTVQPKRYDTVTYE